jgi:hypothetical protein
MIFQQPQKKFNQLLRDKDVELWKTLEEIKRRGLSEWIPLLYFDRGSHAGYPHLLNVEENANKMVPDHVKDTFTAGEIFLLLCSIFLHDIGRIVEKQDTTDTKHHIYSHDIINQCWAQLGLPNEKIAHYCGMIVSYHRNSGKIAEIEQGDPDIIKLKNASSVSLTPYGRLRIPFIAAILRIADETDDTWTRSIQTYLYDHLKSSGINLIKGFRKFIEDVEFCIPGECIILHLPKLEYDDELSENFRINLDNEVVALNGNGCKALTENYIKISNLFEVDSYWQKFLKEQGIRFSKVLIDSENRLLNNITKDVINEKDNSQKLHTIFNKKDDVDNRPGTKEITDAIMGLYLGSMGNNKFSWNALEAQVGQRLSDREKWLVHRINLVSELNVLFYTEDKLSISFEVNDSSIKKINEDLGIMEKIYE